jgi:hypothetical protein
VNFARGHIDDLRIDQQQIKRGFAARGLYGATADLRGKRLLCP